MRPRLLQVEAFGPYPGVEQVDFDLLVDEGIFVIHGPTGAGKTFLLDAVTFALFGEVAGDRTVDSLRSDFAAPDAEPVARLDFDAHGHRWRVERVPRHQRPRVRGDGLVDKAAKAQLWRLEHGDWASVASGVQEVTAKVRELVGLSASQFQQVILLPQGRFEQVLRANSEQREALLRTLFDTQLYDHVAHHLDHRARDEQAAVNQVERRLDELRARAAARWAEVEAPDDADCGHDGNLTPTNQAELDALAAHVAQRVDAAHAIAFEADQRAQTAQRAHDVAVSLAERWDRRAELLDEQEQIAGAAEAIEALRVELQRAEAADALCGTVAELDAASAAFDQASAALVEHARRATHAVDRCNGLNGPGVTRLRTLDPNGLGVEDLAVARDEVVAKAATLDALQSVARRLHDLTTAADDAAIASTDARLRAEAAERDLGSLESSIGELAAEVGAARSAAARLDGLRAAAAAARQRATAAAGLVEASAAVDRARELHLRADRELQDRRSELNDRRETYLAGIAAELAGHLLDDRSCPVCGSLDHPAPASARDDAVTRAEVDLAEASVESARAAERAASEQLQRAEHHLDQLQTAAGGADADVAALEAAAHDADAELAHARSLAAGLDDVERRLAAERVSLDDQRLLAQQAREHAAADAARSAELREQAAHCQDTLAAELEAEVDLDAELRSIERVTGRLDELARALAERQAAESALDQARRRLHRQIDESPFADRAEVVAAARPAPERARRVAELERWDERRAAVTALLESSELDGLPATRPELGDTLRALTDATQDCTVARKAHHLLDAAGTAISEWAEEHRQLDLASVDQRDRARLLAELADQCMGRRGQKVSLQRWVLATYLDEICSIANVRLQSMSSGRYTLRVHAERSGNAKSGLDLRVHDAFSGEERDVKSLSGGETFQSSLALALAVADSVQAHVGGVHLDALFVDEGFGTLDPDALDLAMNELDSLRAGGRMVGVISHVGGLRERIRVGIEVSATTTGSTLRVGELGPE